MAAARLLAEPAAAGLAGPGSCPVIVLTQLRAARRRAGFTSVRKRSHVGSASRRAVAIAAIVSLSCVSFTARTMACIESVPDELRRNAGMRLKRSRK